MRKTLLFNLEPTFRCNLGCEMCPRFSSEDPYLDMSSDTYERICRAMGHAHTVDYTGWGEPMLHKGIYEMIRMAKQQGCRTTMTSNGTVLTERNIGRLIDAGLDRLAVSIDGLTPETYDTIRVGASLEKVTSNLRNLSRLVAEAGKGPHLGIAFTLQEMNAEELPELVPWAESVGARELHVKQLNVVSTAEDWERSFLKYRLDPPSQNGDRLAWVEKEIREVARRGAESGIEVNVHSENPMTSVMTPQYCLAAPLDAVYFSFEGKVAPCCHFGHHVSRYFEGKAYPASALFYGDIREQSFEEIWESPAFAAFRTGFRKEDFPEECANCYLLYGK